MSGISRDIDTAAGDVVPSQTTLFANGNVAPSLVIVNDDDVVSHSPCPFPPSHCDATMIAGSNNVFIGKIAVVNAGDSATCGHTSTGSSTVFVGD